MNPEDAKRLVLQYAERGKVNMAWIADRLGVARQTVNYWFKGTHDPSESGVWLQIANLLGLMPAYSSELIEIGRELALEVLVRSDDADLKQLAARFIREFSKKSHTSP
jgi:transposase-like protein